MLSHRRQRAALLGRDVVGAAAGALRVLLTILVSPAYPAVDADHAQHVARHPLSVLDLIGVEKGQGRAPTSVSVLGVPVATLRQWRYLAPAPPPSVSASTFRTTPMSSAAGSSTNAAELPDVMASIEKRVRDGRTTWLARWRDPDGRQRKRSFSRKADAERYLTSVKSSMLQGAYVDPSAGKVSVAEWACQWSMGLAHLKATTRQRYVGILQLHIVPRWGAVSLTSIYTPR